MAKNKEKQAHAKKKLGELLAKMEKKQAQIQRKTKQLKALKERAAKFLAENPALKPPPSVVPKPAARRKKVVPKP